MAYFEQGHLLWWPALAALLAAILIQIGTNLYNDVGDFERGADTAERLGPPRATAQAWLSARAVRRGARAAFALALLMGAALVAWGGWPILLIGIASLISGWAYTGGRWPIAYSLLGELFVLMFFGVAAVGGTYYLQTFSLSLAALLAGHARLVCRRGHHGEQYARYSDRCGGAKTHTRRAFGALGDEYSVCA